MDATAAIVDTGSGTTESSTGVMYDSSTTMAQAKPAPNYDVGIIPDAPPQPSFCGNPGAAMGALEFSFIWISNSGENTVSKINTVTLEEVGRYATHPVQGNPSRTSVNLNGDVVVANRNGGLAKFYANPADCEDRNDDGEIQTSSGPQDVLAWEDEECRAWFTPFDYSSQRPVAWTSGVWDDEACRYLDARVWSSGRRVEPGTLDVIALDGATGLVQEIVNVSDLEGSALGLYGGAVDQDGNFFGTQLYGGEIIRVSNEDFSVDRWPQIHGGYGMTIDAKGRLWTCDDQASRFDPETETWDFVEVGISAGTGCMVDSDGTLWLGGYQLTGVNTQTLEVVATFELGGPQDYLRGVSVDFQGYVWAVTMEERAFRVHPKTGAYETISGLVAPYTYSDMTGFALANAGGWTPTG